MLLKFFNDYKNGLLIFLGCIIITMSGFVFTKGEYTQYNHERQVIKDCDMGWYEEVDSICKNYKEIQKNIDDKEVESGKIKIPEKLMFDYIFLLASTLQVIFIAMSCFTIGVKYKEEKFMKLWKSIPMFLTVIGMCCVLNLILVFVNGMFSSNDFLRFLFEVVVALIAMVLGRKLK